MTWNNQAIVDNYAASADDASKNWYEDEVNIPSVMALLPNERVRLLDFGCGPGNFTSRLAEHFEAVGADGSALMVQKAQEKFPDTTFFLWDGDSDLPADHDPFPAIVTKLTLEFIEDLPPVAGRLFDALLPGGTLVISVQHPLLAIVIHPDQDIPYWGMPKFDVQIGTTGTSVTKIHRNLGDYIDPFVGQGFRLERIIEPQIPQESAAAHTTRAIDLKFPKRLNIQFSKPK